jgi:DegV family protein with EDD domain
MRIVTDCAADLQPEDVESMGITVSPLYIQFPGEEVDARSLTPDQFYDRLAAMEPEIPSTAMPSPSEFAQIYRDLATEDEDILSIHISLGLSGTADAAKMGVDEAPEAKVTIVDTATLAGGQRFQVLAAALAARAGWSREAILERLDRIRAETEVAYTLETLKYLARGGRIGRVAALAGSLLHIKPVIHVDRADGKYSTLGQARSVPRAMKKIVEHLVELYGADTPVWVVVQHGRLADQAEAMSRMVREALNVSKLEVLRVSPILGVHTGPGIVGVGVVPMSLLEGLL